MKPPRTPEYVSEVLEIPLAQIEWEEPSPAEQGHQRHPLPEEFRKLRKDWWKQRQKKERQDRNAKEN